MSPHGGKCSQESLKLSVEGRQGIRRVHPGLIKKCLLLDQGFRIGNDKVGNQMKEKSSSTLGAMILFLLQKNTL